MVETARLMNTLGASVEINPATAGNASRGLPDVIIFKEITTTYVEGGNVSVEIEVITGNLGLEVVVSTMEDSATGEFYYSAIGKQQAFGLMTNFEYEYWIGY